MHFDDIGSAIYACPVQHNKIACCYCLSLNLKDPLHIKLGLGEGKEGRFKGLALYPEIYFVDIFERSLASLDFIH